MKTDKPKCMHTKPCKDKTDTGFCNFDGTCSQQGQIFGGVYLRKQDLYNLHKLGELKTE